MTDQKGAWSGNRYNVNKSELRDNIEQFDDFVVIATRQGKPVIASNVSETQARNLLKQHASDLMPQTA